MVHGKNRIPYWIDRRLIAASPTLGERSRLALSCSLELGDLLVQLFLGRRQLRNLPLQLRHQPHQLVALRGREVFGLTHSQSIKTCPVPHNPLPTPIPLINYEIPLSWSIVLQQVSISSFAVPIARSGSVSTAAVIRLISCLRCLASNLTAIAARGARCGPPAISRLTILWQSSNSCGSMESLDSLASRMSCCSTCPTELSDSISQKARNLFAFEVPLERYFSE